MEIIDMHVGVDTLGQEMKSDGALKHVLLAFILALGCYVVFYNSIENRRTRKGPWEVTFTNSAAVPALVINQPKLAITNVQLTFAEAPNPDTNAFKTLVFQQPQPVPYEVPFGKCILMDTRFLPGTLVFQMFGHQIELLPRALVIDHQEHPWVSNNTISLHPLQQPDRAVTPQRTN